MTKRLLIATPARGGLPLYYFELFEEVMTKGIPGWDIEFKQEGSNHSLPIARNILASVALKHGYDRILFLDADHPITHWHVARILSHDHVAIPVVSALYCMKRAGKPFFLGIRRKGAEVREDRLLEADFLPTGMLSISTDALRTVAAAHPDREFYVQTEELFTPDRRPTQHTAFEFFPVGVNGPRTASARLNRIKKLIAEFKDARSLSPAWEVWLFVARLEAALNEPHSPGYANGEDYYFSLLCQKAGVSMFLDVGLMIPHEGKITFPITDPNVVATSFDRIPEHQEAFREW